MRLKSLLVAAMTAAISNCALADGPVAAQSLFANLTSAGKSLRVKEKDALVVRTLVRGMYAVLDFKGNFVTYVNHDGSLYGNKHGLYVFPKRGAAPKRMTTEQLAAFRLEVVAAIDRDALIKVVYGNGGDRNRTVLFSAIDCSVCHQLEKNLAQPGRNEVFYVVPSSMETTEGEGLEEWDTVAKIWCAKDKGRAWRNYMMGQAVPPSGQCAFSNPAIAQSAYIHLTSILRNAGGLDITGFPGFVFEDGTLVLGAEGALKQASPSAAKANWLPSASSPSSPMGLPADAFRPLPVRDIRNPYFQKRSFQE